MTKPEKTIPTIQGDEDEPFPSENEQIRVDKNLIESDDIKKEITRFRFKTGRTVLYVSMFAMALAVVADVLAVRFLNVKSDLITSAFEAFKLITMTVLGYFFAANGSDSN